jgi:hypothetical protein
MCVLLPFFAWRHRRLPEFIQQHLTYRLVNELEPIHQKHTIEGLRQSATSLAFRRLFPAVPA